MNPSATRIEHLVTQMKWRLQEGGGEAIYEIGVEDNGTLAGLTKEELDCSLRTIDALAGRYVISLYWYGCDILRYHCTLQSSSFHFLEFHEVMLW